MWLKYLTNKSDRANAQIGKDQFFSMGTPAHAVNIYITCVLFMSTYGDLQGPVVETKLGALRGQHMSVKGKKDVQVYLGLPFAKPPVGHLRLAHPQPTEGWEGMRDATKYPNMCIQNKEFIVDMMEKINMEADITETSEDCLYLNIYTPAEAGPGSKLPVMVWIHGGGFAIGSASIYDGSALAAYQDVVVVTIQYRLGLLGFLSTGDENISGNFGLLDQVEALRWVKEHIQSFGGDPELVTIFGESAGGASVSLLVLSPLSRGLFQRAIAQSGTAAMYQLLTERPLPIAQMVANASGCDITSTEKFASCMKNLDNDTIMDLAKDQKLIFQVNIDGHFLSQKVNDIFRSQEFLKIPFMTGVNNDEGGWLLPSYIARPNWTEGMDRATVMTILSMFLPDPTDQMYSDLMAEEYLGASDDPVKNRNAFTDLLGDLLFNIPAIKTANAHRDAGGPVYLYQFQYAPKSLRDMRPSFVGSDHGDEIFAVLGFCFTTKPAYIKLTSLCTEEELELNTMVMNYWGNFARTGSPNGPGLVQWPAYGSEGDYLSIDLEQEARRRLIADRFTYITETIPEKIREARKKTDHVDL